MKTKFIYVILAALLIGSQTISAQNKDNKTNKQRPTPEQMIQRQANQMVTTLMLDDATAAKFTPVYEKYERFKRMSDDEPQGKAQEQ